MGGGECRARSARMPGSGGGQRPLHQPEDRPPRARRWEGLRPAGWLAGVLLGWLAGVLLAGWLALSCWLTGWLAAGGAPPGGGDEMERSEAQCGCSDAAQPQSGARPCWRADDLGKCKRTSGSGQMHRGARMDGDSQHAGVVTCVSFDPVWLLMCDLPSCTLFSLFPRRVGGAATTPLVSATSSFLLPRPSALRLELSPCGLETPRNVMLTIRRDTEGSVIRPASGRQLSKATSRRV